MYESGEITLVRENLESAFAHFGARAAWHWISGCKISCNTQHDDEQYEIWN